MRDHNSDVIARSGYPGDPEVPEALDEETYRITIAGTWEGMPVEGEYIMDCSSPEPAVILRYTAPEGYFEDHFRFVGEAFEWAMSEAKTRRDIEAA